MNVHHASSETNPRAASAGEHGDLHRPVLNTFLGYLYAQGLTATRREAAELFPYDMEAGA